MGIEAAIIAAVVASVASAGVGAASAAGAFGGPDGPDVPDRAAAEEARRKLLAQEKSRKGRQSLIATSGRGLVDEPQLGRASLLGGAGQ